MTSEEEALLCEEHFDWVVSYSKAFARRQLTDQFADCESDALYGMLLAIRSWDPEAGELRAWIRAKVFHQMVDGIRERLGRVVEKHREAKRNFNVPLDLHFEMRSEMGWQTTLFHETIPDELLSGEFERVETVADLARIIPTLTKKQRALLGAVFWEQISQAEYAERHGISQSGSSKLMTFTLNKIRESYAVPV